MREISSRVAFVISSRSAVRWLIYDLNKKRFLFQIFYLTIVIRTFQLCLIMNKMYFLNEFFQNSSLIIRADGLSNSAILFFSLWRELCSNWSFIILNLTILVNILYFVCVLVWGSIVIVKLPNSETLVNYAQQVLFKVSNR